MFNKYGAFLLSSCFILFSQSFAIAQSTKGALPQEKTTNSIINTLIDKTAEGNTSILIDVKPADLEKFIPTGTYEVAINSFLVRHAGKTILIDAGLGDNLVGNLETLGIKPDGIDTILLTHMHFDHIAGLLNNDRPIFPNATVYVSTLEKAYWENMTDDKLSRNVFKAYENRIRTFDPEALGQAKAELIPGVIPIATYGHTPGHTAYLLQSEKSQLLFIGDLVHVEMIQIARPGVAVTYDVDPAAAIASRKAVFKYVSEQNIPVAGAHLIHSGIKRITKGDKDHEYFLRSTKQ